MKRSSFLLGFLFAPCALLAQSSAYQSADGNTSIFLDNAKGSLIFNVSNTQFDFGYLHEAAGKSFLYGFDVTGKPSSDFASLFQNAKLPAGAGGSASLGRHKLFSQALTHQNETSRLRDDWVLLQVGFTRSSFETAGDALSEPIKRSFNGYKSLAVYDALVNAPGATLLLGVATGVLWQYLRRAFRRSKFRSRPAAGISEITSHSSELRCIPTPFGFQSRCLGWTLTPLRVLI
jgi:hypothetical protein